jgi:hypothetical protein
MHHQARRRAMLLFASILVALAPGLAMSARNSIEPEPADAYLVRQDFSDCTNANVSTNDPSLIGGSMWLVRNPDGTIAVKVAITSKPNTTYHLFLKCVRQLGDITTADEGEGSGNFSFPANSVGSVFAFDMYPEGAPLGNKYQSTQIHAGQIKPAQIIQK